jgi:hypothetical protein
MSMFKWLMVALVLCSAVSLSRAVDKVYMDNFVDGDPGLLKLTPGFAEVTEGPNLFEVMGGERYSKIDYIDGDSWASLRIMTGQQILLSSGCGVKAEWTLVYGKNNDLNQDFRGRGETVFVDWAGFTEADADVTIMLLNDNGGGDEQQAQVTKTTIGGPAAQTMAFTFAQFEADNPHMDFDDIDRVTFYVKGRPGWDGAMEVNGFPLSPPPYNPEPSSMMLLSVAGMALVRRRRRR